MRDSDLGLNLLLLGWVTEKVCIREEPEIPKNHKRCSICDQIVSIISMDEHLKKHKFESEMERNFHILEISRGKRRYATIYRLYRYFDVPPYTLASHTGWSEYRIRQIIGDVFAKQCLRDDSCIFHDVLLGEGEKK